MYESLTFSTILLASTVSIIIYITGLAIYRLYFHPLSGIPGPKLAAVTFFYEFYWEVIQPGQLTWHLHDLHDRYGPIVRLTPNEVHIKDSSYFDEFYARSSGKRNKLPRFSGRFGFRTDVFSTWQHDLHRMRRAAISPFFAAQKVVNLQPMIRSNLTRFTTRLLDAAKTGTQLPIDLAFMSLIGDIMTTYAFAHSYNQLESPTFSESFHVPLKAVFVLGNLTIHFPFLLKLIDACPPWLTQILNPAVMPVVNLYADRSREIREIRHGINKGHESVETPTIFHEMLNAHNVPDEEKNDKRLGDEAVEVIGAGISTSSWCLTVGTFHISQNKTVLHHLRAELASHFGSLSSLDFTNLERNNQTLEWHALEKLPYLSACIRESIRLAGGVATRSPRIAPGEVIRYKNYSIPVGYAISMTSYHVSFDPAIFPDPNTFNPERWLIMEPSSSSSSSATGLLSSAATTTATASPTATPWKKNPDMDRWVVSFGKGTRQCVGMNLAYAEMYMTFAALFAGFDVKVDETQTSWERDVKVSHAFMLPFPSVEGKGVIVGVERI